MKNISSNEEQMNNKLHTFTVLGEKKSAPASFLLIILCIVTYCLFAFTFYLPLVLLLSLFPQKSYNVLWNICYLQVIWCGYQKWNLILFCLFIFESPLTFYLSCPSTKTHLQLEWAQANRIMYQYCHCKEIKLCVSNPER